MAASGPTRIRSDTMCARRVWRPVRQDIACCCKSGPEVPMSMAGVTRSTGLPTALCGTASVRPSNTTALAAARPPGGKADADRRRRLPEVQEPAGAERNGREPGREREWQEV